MFVYRSVGNVFKMLKLWTNLTTFAKGMEPGIFIAVIALVWPDMKPIMPLKLAMLVLWDVLNIRQV